MALHPCHNASHSPTALPQMEAEAAIGEGARLFCPNPQCSMLLLNDDKQADAPIDCPYWCAPPAALLLRRRRALAPVALEAAESIACW